MKKFWRPIKVTVKWIDACVRTDLHGTLAAVLDRAKLMQRESQGWLLRYDDLLTVIARDYDAPEEDGELPEIGDIQIMPSILVTGVWQGRRRVKKDGAQAPDGAAANPSNGNTAVGEGPAAV